jgi:hypothetical protein
VKSIPAAANRLIWSARCNGSIVWTIFSPAAKPSLMKGRRARASSFLSRKKAQTCARAPSNAPHSCGCERGKMGRSTANLAIVGTSPFRVITSTTSLISVLKRPVSTDHDRLGPRVKNANTDSRPEWTKNARKVTYTARDTGEDACAVHMRRSS